MASYPYDASLMLAGIIRRWKGQGKTILIAEHRIAWILGEVTRLVVMENGAIIRELVGSDLADIADRDPFTLSGGQQQRVAIACAMATGRQIIAFDEPTSGLGYGHMMQFAAPLRELSERGLTIIVVTHDTKLIETVADYLLVL